MMFGHTKQLWVIGEVIENEYHTLHLQKQSPFVMFLFVCP